MKKLLLLSLTCLAFVSQSQAQSTITVKDSINVNTTWTKDNQYLLKGYVYVTNGHTLTIDAGTIIKGDRNTKGALIVERGAMIMANGTATAPIVFTSNEAPGYRTYGDWGGVIICGKAPNNWNGGEAQVEGGPRSRYGGTDAHDNSGTITYVRIEFAGIAFSPNNEVNGLTFCSVGDATVVDHVQVSYSGDDSYEFFGGTVNTKHLVSFACWDDDFDTDNGYRGKNQFGVVLRDPISADQSGSKAFESDSYQAGTATGLTDTTMLTRPVFSNFTVMGPMVSPTSTAFDPQYVSAVQIRRGSALSILNSVIGGFPEGILFDESAAGTFGPTTANIANNSLQFRNNIIAGMPTNKDVMYVKDGARNITPTNANADTTTGNPFAPYAGPYTFVLNSSFGNYIYATVQNGLRLQAPFNLKNPNFVPTSTSPIMLSNKTLPPYMTVGGVDPFHNGKFPPFDPTKPISLDTSALYTKYNAPAVIPDFTNSKASDAFFTQVNYVGAFPGTQVSADNWINGWCNFDPVNTPYNLGDRTDDTTKTGITHVAAKSFQNVVAYPNPARYTATVGVEMKANNNLKITLIDITGKVVKVIFNGEAAAGTNMYRIDLSDVTNGLYLVSINTVDAQKTVKLNVIK